MGSLWVVLRSLWVVLRSLWIVVDRCGIVVDRCGSLWVVVDRCGSLWAVPGFSNYVAEESKSYKLNFAVNFISEDLNSITIKVA